jgi:ankyrin repeat protein
MTAGLQVRAQGPGDLLLAIQQNDIESVRRQLDMGVSPAAADAQGDPALFYAALYGSRACMELLLSRGADANGRNGSGQTALMWCAHDTAKLRLLLRYKADVNAVSRSGNSALMVAAVGTDTYEAMKILLDNGADVQTVNKRKETVLMRAASFGNARSIGLLMGRGLVIDAQNGEGMTALMMAMQGENKEAFRLLLDSGADVNVTSRAGWNGLTATIIDDPGLFRAVLDRLRDVNQADADGITPLIWTVYNEHDHPEFVQALLDRGAKVNVKSKDGNTVLAWARRKGNTASVALLLKAGAK